jgi:hypothetical protein
MVMAVICLVFATVGWSQPLADRVPADSVIYFGWPGTDNPVSGYEGSRLQAVVRASNFKPLFQQTLPRVIRRIAQDQPDVAAGLQAFVNVAGPMMRHPTAFFFRGVDFTNPDFPMPQGGAVCRAGTDSQALYEQLEALLRQISESKVPLRITLVGDEVAVLFGFESPDNALPRDAAGALGTNPAFQACLAATSRDPATAFFADFERGMSFIDAAVEQSGDPQAREGWPTLREALGLNGLKRLMITGQFDQREWLESAFLEAPAPRKGLLRLIDAQPIGDDLLRAVPASCTMMFAGSLDLGVILPEARNVAAAFGAEPATMFDRALGAVNLALGANLQSGILDPLGAQWAGYIAPQVAGGGIPGFVLVNRLDDPVKAQQGLMMLSLFTTNSIATALTMQRVPLSFPGRRVEVDGMKVQYIAAPLLAPAWGIRENYLYAGLYPQTVVSGSRFTGHGASILENAEFKSLRDRLGGAGATSMKFVDLPRTAPDAYAGLLVLMQTIGLADMFGVESPPMVLPTFDVFREQMTPAGGFGWVDEQGVRMRSLSPFPGAGLFSGSGAGVGALLQSAGVVVPAAAAQRN